MYATEKDAIITHSVLGKFVVFEGGDTSIPVEGHRDKPNGDVVQFQGAVERGAITTTRFYDPNVEIPFEMRHDKGDTIDGTITVQPIDADGIAIPGRLKTYTGCKVTKIAPPKTDANSYTPSTIQYEFSWVKRA